MEAGRESRTVRAAVFAAVCVLLAALGHVTMSGVGVPSWALAAACAATAAAGWCCTGRERGRVFVTAVTVVTQFVLHSLFSLGQVSAEGMSRGGASLAQQWAKALLCGTGAAARLSPAEADRVVHAAGLGHQLSGLPPGMGSTGSMGSMGSMGAMPGMGSTGSMDSMDPMPGMGSMSPMPSTGMAHMAVHGGAYGMLAAHLLAALLCGLWLAHGERAAFRIGRALAACLFAPIVLLIRIAEPPHRPRVRADRHPDSRPLRSLLLVHAITTRGPPRGTAVA